jgi:hypothetical protein
VNKQRSQRFDMESQSQSQSKSHITTDGQSVRISLLPISMLTPVTSTEMGEGRST